MRLLRREANNCYDIEIECFLGDWISKLVMLIGEWRSRLVMAIVIGDWRDGDW